MDSLKLKIEDGGKMAVDDILATLKRKIEAPTPAPTPPPPDPKIKLDDKALKARQRSIQLSQTQQANRTAYLPKQELTKPLNQYPSLLETFQPRDSDNLKKSAKTQSGIAKSVVETRIAQTESRQRDWVKTGYELYLKYSFALVCFVFLFIGAPMGAIIRKGGFGYPILVSITFFVTFIFLTILCRKLAQSFLMSPFWAAMMPCIVLMPVGGFLTQKAMNDSQMFSTERLDRWIFLLRKRFKKNAKPATAA